MKYKEDVGEIKGQLKSAILINMLPRECQDVAMQFCCGKRLTYEALRDHILEIANTHNLNDAHCRTKTNKYTPRHEQN